MAVIGTKEAAKRLGVTQETVAKWCREGKLVGATQDKKGITLAYYRKIN